MGMSPLTEVVHLCSDFVVDGNQVSFELPKNRGEHVGRVTVTVDPANRYAIQSYVIRTPGGSFKGQYTFGDSIVPTKIVQGSKSSVCTFHDVKVCDADDSVFGIEQYGVEPPPAENSSRQFWLIAIIISFVGFAAAAVFLATRG